MKIAIIGYARDGQAAYSYWNQNGNELTICDQNEQLKLPTGARSQLGADYLKNLDQFDVIVRSAGVPPHFITEANPEAPHILEKVTGIIDEFFRVCPTKHIIGVTGTKGKGTTSTLIAKLLEASGQRVHLGGNIGIPALELLQNDIQPDDWVVLEQSSFQLIDQHHSPHIAVCLMVEPEHLNWHADIEEYIRAKQQIFAHQTAGDIAVINLSSPLATKVAVAIQSKVTRRGYVGVSGQPVDKELFCEVQGDRIVANETTVARVGDVALIGRHNLENVCAAICATWDIIKEHLEVVPKVLSDFKGLPHRLELVAEIQGVKYYDDSFGTVPETAIVALEAFTQPKVLILGGSDKGSDYAKLIQAVKDGNVRMVLTIGDMGTVIAQKLRTVGYENIKEGGRTMTEIVAHAAQEAQSGDVVLLSPACASFGMFADYKDRGEQFTQVVRSLA